uniref:Hemopexin a n=1 Tax=Sphaeramia orbicularis TaxID=375764 RepID=A0A672YKL6_9TELE
ISFSLICVYFFLLVFLCTCLLHVAVASNQFHLCLRFLSGDHVFKGFNNDALLSNESFPELDDHHHVDHVDAAFHMHFDDDPSHEHMFFFLDDNVFSYNAYKLEDGYPKKIHEVFPGIPDHLDAAVECHKGECDEDSVLFFKDHDVYHYNIQTKAHTASTLTTMPNCTAALRFMDHYYCFHGHMFSKFNPKTLEVPAEKYPKEARDFFMKCRDHTEHSERERCSRVDLDAITADGAGHMYAFRGHYYLHKAHGSDAYTADTIENDFRELHSDVDAVFSYNNHTYMIKGNDLYIYQVGEHNTLLDGYPKPLKDELGLEGPIQAAFVCDNEHTAHLIKGNHIFDVDMQTTPHVATNDRPLTHFKKINGAMCGADGVTLIDGNHFYKYESIMLMVASKMLPEAHKVSVELFHCDH